MLIESPVIALTLVKSPIIAFTILITVILAIPPIFERLRLPGLVGLIAAGIVLGKSSLGLLDPETETMKLLSDIGKVYLMFVAGLEIDLIQFKKTRNRSLGFGFLTFIFPMLAGILLGRIFGFTWNTSILIGSLLASHTLLAYPIVSRLGVVANESVTVTIGATILTDTAALVVLAVCVGVHLGDFTPINLVQLLIRLAIYSAILLFGFDWLGKEFFRRSGDEQSKQFLFILSVLFVASIGAEFIGVEKIVGAFLAGIAVNDVLGNSPVKEKVEFVGSVIFIPCFFVDMGLLIDIPAFIKTLSSIWLTLAIVGALIGSKFIAAFVAKLLYRYNNSEMLTMWSLSLPQVAATLAAALVAYQTKNPQGVSLINEGVLNSVIVLMLVTAILGPILTSRFASALTINSEVTLKDSSSQWWYDGDRIVPTLNDHGDQPNTYNGFTVVVPIYNPKTQHYLIEMAALLARYESGRVVPLVIAQAHIQMDSPRVVNSLAESNQRLQSALAISQKFNIEITPTIRIDDNIALGISRASREKNASLIIMGWGKSSGLRARLFGSLIDSVFWSSHCPVAVTRLLISPETIKKILVPVGDLTRSTISAIRFAQVLAESNQGTVELLHVCDRRINQTHIEQFKQELSQILDQTQLKANLNTIASENVARVIINQASGFDLVVIRSMRYRTAGGLAVSEVTTQVIKELTCSMVMLGEPHS